MLAEVGILLIFKSSLVISSFLKAKVCADVAAKLVFTKQTISNISIKINLFIRIPFCLKML